MLSALQSLQRCSINDSFFVISPTKFSRSSLGYLKLRTVDEKFSISSIRQEWGIRGEKKILVSVDFLFS